MEGDHDKEGEMNYSSSASSCDEIHKGKREIHDKSGTKPPPNLPPSIGWLDWLDAKFFSICNIATLFLF